MFSENNIKRLIIPGTWLTALRTQLIDLTLGEHLQILGKRRGSMHKSNICDIKPAISLKPIISCTLFVGAQRNLVALARVWPMKTDSRINFHPVVP